MSFTPLMKSTQKIAVFSLYGVPKVQIKPTNQLETKKNNTKTTFWKSKQNYRNHYTIKRRSKKLKMKFFGKQKKRNTKKGSGNYFPLPK